MSLRTDHIYKIDALYEQRIKTTDDFYKMPVIVGFNHIKDQGESNFGMHFFLDDNQFERIWNRPARYVNMLKRYECMLTVDFSLYTGMPTSIPGNDGLEEDPLAKILNGESDDEDN